MIPDYFRLAYNGARHRKLRSWLTMMGIFIGVAAVVALISLSQGLRGAIEAQFVKLGTDTLLVQAAGSNMGPPGTGVTVPLTQKDLGVVQKVNGVEMAIGRLIRSLKLEYEKEIKYSYLASMPDGSDEQERDFVVEVNNYVVSQGRMLKKGDKKVVMVGSNYAKDIFKKKVELHDRITIQDSDFEVVGILKQSGNPIQDDSIIISESILRDLIDVSEDYDVIALRVQSGESMDVVEERVKKELRQSRNVEEGKEDFTVQTPGSILAILNNILMVVEGVLVGIAGISLLVGGIGIMNTMYTAVLERTREIGIMKALGARREMILLLFLIESGFLGLIGGIIGVILGFAASKLVEIVAFQIYGTMLIQANFSFLLMFGMLLFAFLIGAISGVFPAKQAASLQPVDALRK